MRVVMIVAALLLAAACEINLTTTNTAQNQAGGASPIPSPQVSPSPGAAIASVTLGMFGRSCPAGVTPPAVATQLKPGCVALLTATPKDNQGNPLSPAVHGPDISWFQLNGAGVVTLRAPENNFNRDALALVVGTSDIQAEVKGVRSNVFTIVVVAP